jgi:hypothetical protein
MPKSPPQPRSIIPDWAPEDPCRHRTKISRVVMAAAQLSMPAYTCGLPQLRADPADGKLAASGEAPPQSWSPLPTTNPRCGAVTTEIRPQRHRSGPGTPDPPARGPAAAMAGAAPPAGWERLEQRKVSRCHPPSRRSGFRGPAPAAARRRRGSEGESGTMNLNL